MTLTIEQENSALEPWQDEESARLNDLAIREQAFLARHDAEEYCDLMLANEGQKPIPHGIHALMHAALRCCRESGRHLVIVMPPEHGKTSQIAKWLVWQLGGNPRLRIGLVSGDEDLAKRNLIKMRKTILSRLNQAIFPALKPDVRRSKSGGTWNMTALYFEDMADPCVEVFALQGMSEGARLDIIWLDDTVTRKCMRSEAERELAQQAIFGTWLQRKTANGFCIFTNNVWHREDPIHKMIDSPSFMALWVGYEETDRLYWRVHHPAPGWEYKNEGTLPLWECWPKDRLEIKRDEDRSTYTRLYKGKAVAAEEFRFPPFEEWGTYKSLPMPGSEHRIVGFLDPSGGKNVEDEDYAALWALLVTESDVYVADCWVERAIPSRQINMLWEMHEKLVRLGYRGFDALELEVLPKDEGWVMQPFRQEMERRRKAGLPHWNINLLAKNPYENKLSRIERLDAPLRNKWLLWPEGLDRISRDGSVFGRSLRKAIEQMEDFPFGDHDDGPDALSGAYDLAEKNRPFIPPLRIARNQAAQWLKQETLERERDNRLDTREPEEQRASVGSGWNL